MLCKIDLLCSLIITQCAEIFLIFMSRVDVIVYSCPASVFSATLVTLVFSIVMNTINMSGQIGLLGKLFPTIIAFKPFSEML